MVFSYHLIYLSFRNSVRSLGTFKVMTVCACFHLFSSPWWVFPTHYWPVHCGPWWPLWYQSISWAQPMACMYRSRTRICSLNAHSCDCSILLFLFIDLMPSSISMQSIQNLGLALIAMAAGAILDSRGYLLLEVFFCACICSQYFLSVCVFVRS